MSPNKKYLISSFILPLLVLMQASMCPLWSFGLPLSHASSHVAYSDGLHSSHYVMSAVRARQERESSLQPELAAKLQHAGWVSGVALSPDGRLLATCSFIDQTLRVWDVATVSEVRRLSGVPFWAVSFSPDSKLLAASVEGAETILIDVATWKILHRLGAGQAQALCCRGSVTFSPDGKLLLVGEEGRAHLWEVATGREKQQFKADGPVSSVAFSNDGRLMAIALQSTDTALVIDLASGREVRRIGEGLFYTTSVAFSPDGKTLLVGSHAGTRVWDIASGERLRSFPVGMVWGAVFTPDGKNVITVSENDAGGTLNFWDAATGEPVKKFDTSPQLFAISLARDGCLVAVGGQDESVGGPGSESKLGGAAHVWNLCGGTSARTETSPALSRPQPGQPSMEVQLGNTSFVNVIAFSPDGSLVATGDEKVVVLWQAATGREIRHLILHDGSVKGIYFSQDGRTLLTGSTEGYGATERHTIQLWNLATGAEVKRFEGFKKSLKGAALSPDGRLVMAEEEDGLIHLFDVSSGKEAKSFAKGTQEATDALRGWRQYGKLETGGGKSVSPDGRFTAEVELISEPPRVLLRESSTGRMVRLLDSDLNDVHSVLFSPDGKYVLGGGTGAALWDVETGEEVRKFDGLSGPVYSASFSKDGSSIMTASLHGEQFVAALWDTSSGTEGHRIEQPADGFWVAGVKRFTAALSPDSNSIITGTLSGEVRLWDAEQAKQTRRQTDKLGGLFQLTSVSFSPDGKYILTSQLEGTSLWDNLTGKLIRKFSGQTLVTSAVFSPDGQFIATTSNDKNAVVWDAQTGQPVRLFDKHDSWVLCAAFSPDNRYLVTGEIDGAVRLWDNATGELVRVFKDSHYEVASVKFSPDGNYILAGGGDGVARLWDRRTGAISRRYEGQAGSVNTVEFSADGNLVLTGNEDGTTRVWRTKSADELCRLVSFRDGSWVIVTPDGRFDTNNLERVSGLYWLMPDAPFSPLPFEIFMRDYYEPKLLPRLLKCTKDGNCEKEFKPVRSLATLNRAQPVVKIVGISQSGNSETANVTIEVANATSENQHDQENKFLQSGVYDVRLFRDGQLVGYEPATDGPVKLDGQGQATITKTVRLPRSAGAKQVEFSAYAFNSDRVKSSTERKMFELPPNLLPLRGRAYIIAVGVNANENPTWDLRFAANDAREFERIVPDRLRATKEYEEVIPVSLVADYTENGGVRSITESSATKENFHTVLALLAGRAVDPTRLQGIPNAGKLRAARPEDIVLIAFSSHGYADRDGVFYLVPYDTGGSTKVADILPDCISSDELSLWLRDVDAGRLVMIVDACYSAAAIEGQDFKPGPMGSRGLGQLAYDKGMTILASTQANNVALENKNLRQGLLSYALTHEGIEELLADYKPKDGAIMLGEWLGYGVARVPQLYQEVKTGKIRLLVQQGSGGQSASSQLQQPSLFDFRRRRADAALFRQTQR